MGPPTPEVRYVHAKDGVRLALTVLRPRGRARACALLVHGFSQNRLAFLAGHIPDILLDAGLVVVVGELRGHGLSDRPHRWTLEHHLGSDFPALERAARSLHGHDRVHLVGHSMGGILGYASLARSNAWTSVVTIAAPLRLGRGSPLVAWAARASRPVSRWAGKRGVPVDRLLRSLSGPLSSPRRELRAFQRVLALTNPEEAAPERLREVLLASDPESMDVFRAFLELVGRPNSAVCGIDLEAAVRSTSCPVAAVVGTRDIFASPLSVSGLIEGRERRHRGPRRLVALPRASHVDLTVGPAVGKAMAGLLGFMEVP